MTRRKFIKRVWVPVAFGIFVPRLLRAQGALTTFYVNTASTAGGDGTTNNTAGATRAFASLQEAINSGLSVSAPRLVLCSGTAADTLTVLQANWNHVSTTAVNYLRIEGDNTSGKWNTNAYRLEVTDFAAIYNNNPGHVRIKNVQAKVTLTAAAANSRECFRLSTQNVGTGFTDCDCRFENCIARASVSGTSFKVVGYINSQYAETNGGICRLFNCVAFNCAAGFESDDSSWAATNLKHYNCSGFGNSEADFENAEVCINCLGGSLAPSAGNFISVGTGGGASDYNASVDASAIGTHKRINQTFSFVDASNGDLHLQSNDTGAKDFGISDPGSGLFSTDIDGQTRTGSWDIGADEFQNPTFTNTFANCVLKSFSSQ